MAELIIITGGKGGVGKSTVCVGLGMALARLEKRVLLLETGQRSMDILLGRDDVLYDLEDVLCGRCSLENAALEAQGVSFLCAPAGGLPLQEVCDPDLLYELLSPVDEQYDYILAEIPLQQTLLEAFSALAERAMIVSSPERSSARGGRTASDILAKAGVWDIRLCVNVLPPDFMKKRPIPDIDWLIDTVCAQLICMIPFCQDLISGGDIGNCVMPPKILGIIFDNFAQRIIGRYIDLLVC